MHKNRTLVEFPRGHSAGSYQRHGRRSLAAAVAVATITGSGLLAASPVYAAGGGNNLTIDAASVVRPVTHVGAGGLYALADNATPPDSVLYPLHLNQLVQPAPGVQQLGNGATVPTGDALKVAASMTDVGAQETVRMPDIYPDFPYKWVSWDDWLSKVDTMVKARLAATGTTNVNGWEPWNEPDWTWDTTKAGSFLDGWTRTYKEIRSLDTVTPIVGPSYSAWNLTWMKAFLQNAIATNTVPDVISWHELSGYGIVEGDVAAYRALEKELGIGPLPIEIEEYAEPNEVDAPSDALHYLAAFERSGVRDAQRAYWFESGTVDGLLFNNQPTSTYWMYKWYGDLTGNIVSTTPSGNEDGVAALDSTRKVLDAVVGGATGNNTVTINDLTGFGADVKVNLQYTPTSGRYHNTPAPTNLWTRTLPVVNGTVTVPIGAQDPGGAYNIVVTPAAGPTSSYQQTYEAENATVVNAQRLSSATASNGGYVGRLDNSGDVRSDSFVDFMVDAPVDGTYDFSIRYANGGGADATQGLAYNGSAFQPVTYPATAGWGQFASVNGPNLELHKGYNVIRLAKGSPGFAGGSGFAELDSITIKSQSDVPTPAAPADAPVATFVTRAEAETSTVTDAQKLTSPNASGGGYVGTINNADSSVRFPVTVPAAGVYKLTVGYANGGNNNGFKQNGTSDAVLALSTNGGTPTNVTFPVSGQWGGLGGSFPTLSTTVTLDAGDNTVQLTNLANQNYAELDYIEVSSPADAVVDGRITTITAGTPTISGSPIVGRTLTADPGTWTPATATLTYQWLANGIPISGATGIAYTPTSADIGRQISVTVTGTQLGYATASATSTATELVQGVVVAGIPTVTGEPVVGSALTANPGTWAPGDAILTYQWLADGTPVTGATGNTYVPVAADAGKHISVTVTGDQSGYIGASATSTATGLVINPSSAAKVTLTSASSPSAAGWYTQNVTVTLAAPQSGQKVQYSLDGGTWTNYSRPLTLRTNGSTTIDTRVLTAKGDVIGGSGSETVVKIDKTAPTASVTRNPDVSTGTPLNPLSFTFTAADTYSGVASVQYQVNRGAWTTAGSAPLVLDRVGSYTIAYRATDAAGHLSSVRSFSVRITANVITSVKAGATSVRAGSPVTLTLAGYARYDSVQISYGASTTSVMTDVKGSAKVTVTVPGSTPTGAMTITATGSDGSTADTRITVK